MSPPAPKKSRLASVELEYARPPPVAAPAPEVEVLPRRTELVRDTIAGAELTPVELMLCVLRDETLPLALRLVAAKDVAPYLHQKKPLALEQVQQPTLQLSDLRGLSRAELEQLQAILSKTGAVVNG